MENAATLVIRHRIAQADRPRYEVWLNRIVPAAAEFEGHQGVNVIRPADGEDIYTISLHFIGLEHLYGWSQSPRRQALVDEIRPLLADDDQLEVRLGSQFWFTPTIARTPQPPAWKQFLVTLAVIFPSTNLVPWLWHQLLPSLDGTLLGHFLADATVVALVVYLWMPLITRALADWLAPADRH